MRYSLSVVVANWLVSHAKREKAGLGDGCTNTAAGRPNISAKLEQHAGGTVSFEFTVLNLQAPFITNLK